MKTHYDNLKIAENAPPEVVKAAYRALSQRYHPDKNPGNKDSARIMTILNSAYETLSDPVRRQQYDAFLAQARQPQRAATVNQPRPQSQSAPVFHPRWSLWQFLLRNFWLTLIVVIFAWNGVASLFKEKRPKQPYSPNPAYNTDTRSRPQKPSFDPSKPFEVIRPATAPNGRPWPINASYLPDYPVLATGGLSSVAVDNTRNSSDVFLKLVSLNAAQAYPVRLCYIPAHSQFKFQTVAAGRYDVRYRDLSIGGYSKTEEFTLTQTETSSGTEFSNLSLTLYKVSNGNMHTETIVESEF